MLKIFELHAMKKKLTEVEQYLEQAIACGAKNCTAALLEYKNAHKGAVDPMDAFVLD